MNESVVKSESRKLNRQAYNTFVKQVEIKDIRLVSATIQNLDCNYYLSSAEVKWKMTATYENQEKKIDVFHRYNVRILEKGKELKSKVAVTFCVTYGSKVPMTEEYFEQFKGGNLPLNTWPYFREFVHNAVLRMGWPPFIAPIFTV